MDYFFAACEELKHPKLKSKAFVVGTATIAKKERGVVQTCNYKAREFGIRSAMPVSQALKLKPDLVYLESDDAYYEDMSSRVMALLKGYGMPTEVISIDEAAIDIGNMPYDDAGSMASAIKKRINSDIGLPCTIGISTGKVYAKMICDSSKPNGIGLLKGDDISGFLKDKKIGSLLGVGRKTEEKLNAMGIDTIGKLSKADPNVLVEKFGKHGKELYILANGTDLSKVSESYEVLSVGRERTLESETDNADSIVRMLGELSKEVIAEVKKKNLWFKGVSVKARYSDFTERIKNRKLNNYTNSIDTLNSTAMQLAKELIDYRKIRKIGVRVYIVESRKGQRSIL
ncbi:MAG: DNA polymerase IV [Candidatus Micrarchaeaceae archaeon]